LGIIYSFNRQKLAEFFLICNPCGQGCLQSVAKTGIRYSRAAIIRMTSACMFNLNIFNKISSEVLTIKNDLELNSENQLITKYKTSTSEDYKQAIVLIFKERGYTRLEIGQLLREPKAS
jgi:hypothetical protein